MTSVSELFMSMSKGLESQAVNRVNPADIQADKIRASVSSISSFISIIKNCMVVAVSAS